MCSGAAVMLCLSQARGLPAIVLLAGLAGLAGELYRPASSALLADLVPTGQRVTAYAAYRAAFNAGWAFGPATAGWLAEKSFLWLFVGDAVTSILYAVVAWVWLPSGLRKESASNALADTVRVLRQDARFRQLLFASLLVGLVFVQLFSTMSLAVTQRGFSAATYGLIISLNGALVVLFELPLTSLTKRLPARKVMAFGYALIGIGFAFTGVASTLPLLILAMVLLTFGEMASMPIAGAYVADLAPTDNRGLYMGTYGLVWAVATVCGPGLGLVLFSANPTVLWVLCGVLGALAAGIMLAGSPGSVFGWRGPGLSAVRRVRE
jgi:MFS family permease